MRSTTAVTPREGGRWLPKLSALEPRPESLVVSKDARRSRGDGPPYKVFALCPTWATYAALLTHAEGHLYEVIPDGRESDVFFYADHDCDPAKARSKWTADEFCEAVLALHMEYFGLAPGDVGRTVQLCSSCRPDKLSVHVKINVHLPGGALQAGSHAEAIGRLAGGRTDLAPDMAVYSSRNQQLRCVGRAKMTRSAYPKAPWGDSSPKWRDHFVRRHPNNPQPMAEILHRIRAPPPLKRSRAAADESRAAEAGEVACLRAAIRASGLASRLGPVFDADTCRVDSVAVAGDAMSMYLDGTMRTGGSVACPFAGRVHRSNRAFVRAVRDPDADGKGVLHFFCMDPDCRDGRLSVPYDISPLAPPPPPALASRAAS